MKLSLLPELEGFSIRGGGHSSGMYVRLAFLVAPHLDPDVLIVGEVLAVAR